MNKWDKWDYLILVVTLALGFFLLAPFLINQYGETKDEGTRDQRIEKVRP